MVDNVQEKIQTAINTLDNKVSPQVKKDIEKVLMNILENHVPLKQAIGLSPEIEEMIYNQSYKLFQSGKYKEALRFFEFLRQWDYTYRYNLAIAACYHYMGQYEFAAANYILCTYIDPENPVPYFHLYNCFTKLNDPLASLKSISSAIYLAERNPNYDLLKERATLEYKELKKSLKQAARQETSKE